jgi:hypothetical protein
MAQYSDSELLFYLKNINWDTTLTPEELPRTESPTRIKFYVPIEVRPVGFLTLTGLIHELHR